MTEPPKQLKDYLKIFKRRKRQFILPFFVILASTAALAFLLPPVYRSTATILIEDQEIPRELVRSTVTGFADQRIEVIKQRIMRRASLLKIIEQYELYEDLRRKKTTEEVLEQMVEDVALNVISAEVTDERTGRPTNATIAFTLSYDAEIPLQAQRVANELTSLFLAENLKMRAKNAKETTAFLKQEAEKLFNQAEELEQNIALFKEKNAGALPELVQFNMQLLEQTNRNMMDVEQQTRSLEDREIYLKGQLATIDPVLSGVMTAGGRLPSPRDRLKLLRSERISLSARLSPEHPDVIQINREIAALAQELGETNDRDVLKQSMAEEQLRFRSLLDQFGEDHPDVIQSDKVLSALQSEIDKLSQKQTSRPDEAPENPLYITIHAQLASTENDLRALSGTRKKLEQQRAKYAHRIEASPMVERGYKSLVRNRDNLMAQYQGIKAKLLEAEVAEGMEHQRKGERFSLIEPPFLPEKPVKPNRPAILFLGLVFSLAGGFGFMSAAEGLDETIYDSSVLEHITGIAPVGTIPIILNAAEQLHLVRRRRSFVIGLVGIMVIVIVAVHFLLYPLDVFWFAALRKMKG